jgi:phage terminase small subunit
MAAVIEHSPASAPALATGRSAYDSLKPRHRLFVDAFVEGASAADAVRVLGYKGRRARQSGWKLLRKPRIAAAIEERKAQMLEDAGLRQHHVIEQLAAIARCDPRRLVNEAGEPIPLHRLDPQTAAAISAVEIEEISSNGEKGTRYKYRFWDKGKANDRLGQWLNLWEASRTNVNVDARSVTVNNAPGGEAALQGAIRLLERVRAIGAVGGSQEAAAACDSDGSLLPAPVCDEPIGRGASVDAGEDSGGPE